MNLLILSIENTINFYNLNFINIKTDKKFFTIMKKHVLNICNINKIKILNKSKVILIKINKGFLFQKKNTTIVICNYYEFL